MRHVLPMLTILGCVVAFAGLGCEEDEGECRIYLAEDGTGEIEALYVVNSPKGEDGDWGDNLMDTVKEEYVEDDWRVFRFKEGRTVDHKVEYEIYGSESEFEKYDGTCDNGEGIKYEISGGNLFTTYFNFD